MTDDVLELQYDKSLLRVPKGLWYAGYDTWARIEGEEATVGIADFLQTKLGDVMFVTPEPEESFEQDDIFATVESTKAAVDLTIPVSGEVIAFKVFGPTPPCANCKRAEQEAREAAAGFPGQVEVVKLDAHGPKAQKYDLVVTPMVVVGEQVVAAGRILPASKLIPIIEKQLGG